MNRLVLPAAAAAGLLSFASPQTADACGGTFCDAGQPMAVDQTGENILFVMGDGFVEAHIQIQYDPNSAAAQFAWIVPLMDVPEFSVGSDPLFDAVLASTVPAYGFNTSFDGDGCFGGSGGGITGGGGSDGGPGTDSGDGPEVLLQEVVGAFEVTVLQGGTAEEVNTWLTMNNYQVDDAATPILGEYLAEGFMFAAFKLVNEEDVAEIHPIVLRFPAEEACVPLRLTRIAAVDDMEVRAFFLAENRVVPQTYKHVLVNPLKLDWPNRASNYKDVVTLAVDADTATGRAFVTEYAGPSDVVSASQIFSANWNATAFEAIAPVAVVDELTSQGLIDCTDSGGGTTTTGAGETGCFYSHPLLPALLEQYLPVPVGVDEIDFYGCLTCFMGQIDMTAWDGVAFAADMQERIVDPGSHALSVLLGYPTLTRMYTTISPAEMTADPLFHENPDLPDVDLRSEVANRLLLCDAANGDELWTLPDGRVVYAPGGFWPSFDDEMPWEEEVADVPDQGPPINLEDHTELINTLLAQHNCSFNYPSAGECTGGATGTTGTGGPGGTTGSTGGSAGVSAGAGDGSSSGCGCRSARPGPMSSLLGIALLGFLRRRRR